MDTILELSRGLVPSVLLIGALLFVRRGAARGRIRGGDKMRVAERIGVSRGASVAVVEIDGRRFLLGATEHGVSLLSELDEQPEHATADEPDPAASPPFTAFLQAMGGRPLPSREGAMLRREHGLPGGGLIGLVDRLRSLTARSHSRGAAS